MTKVISRVMQAPAATCVTILTSAITKLQTTQGFLWDITERTPTDQRPNIPWSARYTVKGISPRLSGLPADIYRHQSIPCLSTSRAPLSPSRSQAKHTQLSKWIPRKKGYSREHLDSSPHPAPGSTGLRNMGALLLARRTESD